MDRKQAREVAVAKVIAYDGYKIAETRTEMEKALDAYEEAVRDEMESRVGLARARGMLYALKFGTATLAEIDAVLDATADKTAPPSGDDFPEPVDYDRILTVQSTILRGVANAFKGEPDELSLHSHHDLAALARSTMLELEVLRAQNELLSNSLKEREVGEAQRSAEWRKAVRSAVIDFENHEDESDDPAVLRDCLIRTRLGASAERQCSIAKSVVADILPTEMKDGRKVWRFVVSVPTGDLGELAEAARLYLAAWNLAIRDAERADHATWKRMSDAVIEAVAALDEDDTRFADESRVSMALAELTKLAREFGPQSHTPEERPTDPEVAP